MSARRVFYLGRHPIALMIEMCLYLLAVWLVAAWTALIVTAWGAWAALVTVNWACQAAADGLRRRG